jgi:hypothetical protein
VLRPRPDDEFLFLGLVYVYNLVHGELVRDMQDGKIQARGFCLV